MSTSFDTPFLLNIDDKKLLLRFAGMIDPE